MFHLTRRESRFTAVVIRHFVRAFNVDLTEARHESASAYQTFNAFFTRELKADARPIDHRANVMCSPVDGCVSQLGPINAGQIFQAKGFSYSVTDLLGGREADARLFNNGSFATLYLSPRDYHRIHMPVDATLKSMHYIPGRLYSVAPHTVRTVGRLFARNERVVALFDSAAGPLAMVLVGAINVAAIETVWAGLITPPTSPRIKHTDYTADQQRQFVKGEEMGRFNMGSTVILLAQQNVQWSSSLIEGSNVRMGEFIGHIE